MKLRIISKGVDNAKGGFIQIELNELTNDEKDALLATLRGQKYVTIKNGNELHFSISTEVLPTEIDEEMAPFWRKHRSSNVGTQMELFPGAGVKPFPITGASFIIQHLCGYHYTDEKYKKEAEKLKSFGFDCLRSRRQADATFWEMWFLPGSWSAKGDLLEHIETFEDSEEKDKAIIDFLRGRCSFGTLDVMCQKLAMRIPD